MNVLERSFLESFSMTRVLERIYQWLFEHLKISFIDLPEIQDYANQRGYHVCYILRRENLFLRWILDRCAQKNGLPVTSDRRAKGFSADAESLALRPRSLLLLSTWQARRYRESIEAKCEALPERTILVPVKLFAGRGPKPFPFISERLSIFPLGEIWSAFIFLFYRKDLELEYGAAIPLSENRREDINKSSRSLYRSEKLRRGAAEHTEEQVERIVLSGPEYEELLSQLSDSEHLSYFELNQHASSLLKQLRGRTSTAVIILLRKVLEPIISKIFEGINVTGIEEIKGKLREHPCILLPNHRSHFDYILLSYVLFRENLPLPYIAAGENLDFFPVGFFLRRSGAFFIRRRSQRDPLYKFILERYIIYLLKKGHEIEFFIEGGRSRSGLSLEPRLGLLKYLIQAIHAGERKDAALIPISITYEKLPEEQSLAREMLGEKKRSENILGFFKAKKILKRRFGSVSVQFGEARLATEITTDNLFTTAVSLVREQAELTEITPPALYAAALTLVSEKSDSKKLASILFEIFSALVQWAGGDPLRKEQQWEEIQIPARLKLNVATTWCVAGKSVESGMNALIDYVKERYPDFPNNDAVREYYKNQLFGIFFSDVAGQIINRVGQPEVRGAIKELFSEFSPIRESEKISPSILEKFFRETILSGEKALQLIDAVDDETAPDEVLEEMRETHREMHTGFNHYSKLVSTMASKWRGLPKPIRADLLSALSKI